MAARAGWYPDTDMPGTVRFWDGKAWTKQVAPAPPKPMSAWKGIRIVAVGVLAAGAVAFTVWRLSQPTDVECAVQRVHYATGQSSYYEVEEPCREGLLP